MTASDRTLSRPNRSHDAIERWLALIAIAFPLIGCFFRTFTGDEILFFRDAGHYYFPLFESISQEWRQGRVPLWGPHENCGLPWVADATSSVFYPLKLIFFLPCPYPALYNGYLVLHVVIAAANTWMVTRRWEFDRSAAALASIAYALGGSILFLYSNVVFLVGAAWLPLGIGITDRVIAHRCFKAATQLGVVLAIMVLGGDPQAAYHLLLAGLILLLVRTDWRCRSLCHSILVLAYAAVICFGLAAVQILPSSEWMRESERATRDTPRSVWEAFSDAVQVTGVSPVNGTGPANGKTRTVLEHVSLGLLGGPPPGSHHSDIYHYSFAPWHLVELVWPHASGHLFPQNHRWMGILPAEGAVWVPSIYLGLIPFLLAIGSWSLRSPEPRIRWLSWLAILCVAAAFGVYGLGWILHELFPSRWFRGLGNAVGGVYWLMVSCLPGYAYFRYPAKLLVPFALSVSLLAGYGLQSCRDHWNHLRVWLVRIGWASLTFSVLLLANWQPFASWITSTATTDDWLGPVDGDGAVRDVLRSFAHGGIVIITTILLFRGVRDHHRRAWFLVGITSLELLVASSSLVVTVPVSLISAKPVVASMLNQQQVDQGSPFRTYRPLAWLPKPWAMQGSPDRMQDSFRWDHETLFPKHALRWQLPYLESPSSIASADFNALLEAGKLEAGQLEGAHFGSAQGLLAPPLLDLLSVRTLILPPDVSFSDTSPSPWLSVDVSDPQVLGNLSLWINPHTMPRTRIVHNVVLLPVLLNPTRTDLQHRTQEVLFEQGVWRNFRTTAVIETSDAVAISQRSSAFTTAPSEPASAASLLPDDARTEYAVIVEENPQQVVIDAHLSTAGLLVLGDLYAPGWTASIVSRGRDDIQVVVPILRTNRVMRGVWLEPGHHRVTFRYRPQGFMRGTVISLTTLVGLIIASVLLVRRNARNRLAP